MKAVLVLDMPNDCDICPLDCNGYCVVLQEYTLLNEWVEDAPYYSLKEKGDCPLRPLPTDMIGAYANSFAEDYVSFTEGWDACLKEITK